MRLMDWLTTTFWSLPLVRELLAAPPHAFARSKFETIFTQIFSTLPTTLSILLLLFFPSQTGDSLSSLFGHGELFLYATATLAPVFLLATTERKYPSKRTQILLSVVVLTISVGFIGFLKKADDLSTWTLVAITTFSAFLFAISILLQLIAGIYQNPPDDDEAFRTPYRQQERESVAKFRNRPRE